MRNIRTLMANEDFDKIPGELRKMRRLWTNTSIRGVALRREHQARLFENYLTTRSETRRFSKKSPRLNVAA
jgi:hypothetical protein